MRRSGSAPAGAGGRPPASAGTTGSRCAGTSFEFVQPLAAERRPRSASRPEGRPTIRGSPSTISVSFANAFRLSFDRVLARFCSARFRSFARHCVQTARRTGPRRRRACTRGRGCPSRRRRPSPPGTRAPTGQVDRLALLLVEAAVAAGDGEAGGQPLHVPLERARKRLVEVVDAEHEPPIGRGERAEVRQMRITAQLHLQTGPRQARQIRGHQVGRATVERERRHQHPPIPDRHELRHPCLRLLFEERHGARSARTAVPTSNARNAAADLAPSSPAPPSQPWSGARPDRAVPPSSPCPPKRSPWWTSNPPCSRLPPCRVFNCEG